MWLCVVQKGDEEYEVDKDKELRQNWIFHYGHLRPPTNSLNTAEVYRVNKVVPWPPFWGHSVELITMCQFIQMA